MCRWHGAEPDKQSLYVIWLINCVYVQTMTSFLNTVHVHHATLAWRWCLVRRWPPVAVWGVYRYGWALGHDLRGGRKGEQRYIRRERKLEWRKVGGKRGENGVSKGREYTTWLVLSNRKSICSRLTFQWGYDMTYPDSKSHSFAVWSQEAATSCCPSTNQSQLITGAAERKWGAAQ